MLKLTLLALVFAFKAHAEKAVESNNTPQGDVHCDGCTEQQDGEEYAVTPGNPKAGDDAITGEANNSAACLSADTVKRYEKKSAGAVKKVKTAGLGISPKNVLKALKAGGLVPENVASLGASAQNGGPALKKLKYVNLMECKEWRAKFKDGAGEIPLGAVLVYKGGKHGDMRLKTPSGCGGSNGRTCQPVGQTLTGVYVQIAN